MERPPIGTIVVPVDGSEFSDYATAYAVRIAALFPGVVLFVHVIDEQLIEQLAGFEAEQDRMRIRDRLLQEGQAALRRCAHVAEAEHLTHEEIVVEGDPCSVICEVAANRKAGLIVMGKIGRRGARRILVGSLTRRVIESSETPVLVVTRLPVP